MESRFGQLRRGTSESRRPHEGERPSIGVPDVIAMGRRGSDQHDETPVGLRTRGGTTRRCVQCGGTAHRKVQGSRPSPGAADHNMISFRGEAALSSARDDASVLQTHGDGRPGSRVQSIPRSSLHGRSSSGRRRAIYSVDMYVSHAARPLADLIRRRYRWRGPGVAVSLLASAGRREPAHPTPRGSTLGRAPRRPRPAAVL